MFHLLDRSIKMEQTFFISIFISYNGANLLTTTTTTLLTVVVTLLVFFIFTSTNLVFSTTNLNFRLTLTNTHSKMNFFELINNTFVRFFVFETWLEVDPATFPLEFSQRLTSCWFQCLYILMPKLAHGAPVPFQEVEFLTPKQLPLAKKTQVPFLTTLSTF